MDRQLDFLDLLAVASFVIGYENLVENRQQSAQNDVSKANDKQAKFLLNKINERLDRQDRMLKDLLEKAGG